MRDNRRSTAAAMIASSDSRVAVTSGRDSSESRLSSIAASFYRTNRDRARAASSARQELQVAAPHRCRLHLLGDGGHRSERMDPPATPYRSFAARSERATAGDHTGTVRTITSRSSKPRSSPSAVTAPKTSWARPEPERTAKWRSSGVSTSRGRECFRRRSPTPARTGHRHHPAGRPRRRREASRAPHVACSRR